MKKGDIIRRKVQSGTPVGAYMKVSSIIADNTVEAQICELDMVESEKRTRTLYVKRNLYVCKVCKIPIQDAIWQRIHDDRQIAIIHDSTPQWEKMFDTEPELVEIRSVKYPQKRMVFVIDQIGDCYYNRTRQIRLTLGTRII